MLRRTNIFPGFHLLLRGLGAIFLCFIWTLTSCDGYSNFSAGSLKSRYSGHSGDESSGEGEADNSNRPGEDSEGIVGYLSDPYDAEFESTVKRSITDTGEKDDDDNPIFANSWKVESKIMIRDEDDELVEVTEIADNLEIDWEDVAVLSRGDNQANFSNGVTDISSAGFVERKCSESEDQLSQKCSVEIEIEDYWKKAFFKARATITETASKVATTISDRAEYKKSPWQNPDDSCDTRITLSNDGVTPQDSLYVIMYDTQYRTKKLPKNNPSKTLFPDVNGDWYVNAEDASIIIDHINATLPPRPPCKL